MKKIQIHLLGLALAGLLAAIPAAAENTVPSLPESTPAIDQALATPADPGQDAARPVQLADIFSLPQIGTANECYCYYWDPMFCERVIGWNCSCNLATCGCDCE